jgi:cell division transport system permease protein
VVVAVAISLAFLGMGLMLREQVDAMKGYWYDKVEVAVFLCPRASASPSCAEGEVTDTQRQDIRSGLEELPEVEKVYYESKAEAYRHYQEQYKDSAIAESISVRDMPESFRVKLTNPENFDVVDSAFSGRPGVDLVQDERELLDRFFQALNVMQWFSVGLWITMLLVALLLITNTIRLAAFSRRRETGIMRLVGASNFYIQLPFILEGAIAGLIGAVLASLGLLAVQFFLVENELRPSFGRIMAFVGWDSMVVIVPIVIIVGVAMSSLASFLTLRRYLRV